MVWWENHAWIRSRAGVNDMPVACQSREVTRSQAGKSIFLNYRLKLPPCRNGEFAAANALVINFTTAYGMLVRECDIYDHACGTNCIDMEKFNS